MRLDIVFVTYNSEKWIEGCFDSIAASDFDLKDVTIIIHDNNSSDKTLELLEKVKNRTVGVFRDFIIIGSSENLGFGKGNNRGAAKGDSENILFLNIDTTVYPDTLRRLREYIEASDSRDAVWELRQFPYEHPKLYDPISLETSWVSGAAFVARRAVFNEIGGFDEHIFMYAEDVDLSWRIRACGYRLKYAPKAVVNHYCYTKVNEVKPNQYYNSLINNMLLRYKFGGIHHIYKGYLKLVKVIMGPQQLTNSRKILLKKSLGLVYKAGPYMCWRFRNLGKSRRNGFRPSFYGWDYATIRSGAFHFNELPVQKPLVSVIVRTCGRPDVLRETLVSLRNQTYGNLEVIVVEDGEDVSRAMIESEFEDLNIKYEATVEKVGRSRAGNKALELSKGKYVNFLDDDDVFYADHVEVLVSQLLKHPGIRAAYSVAFETPIVIRSRSPYSYRLMDYNTIHSQSFNRTLLFHHNYIPIQSIMFDRELYLENGGIDESLEVLEDWDLWVRYACSNDFLFVDKTTSEYRVPFDRKTSTNRQELFDEALGTLREKHKAYAASISVQEAANNVQDIYNSFVVAIDRQRMNRMVSRHPLMMKLGIKLMALARRVIG